MTKTNNGSVALIHQPEIAKETMTMFTSIVNNKGKDDKLIYKYPVYSMKILYNYIWNDTLDDDSRNKCFYTIHFLLYNILTSLWGVTSTSIYQEITNHTSINNLLQSLYRFMIDANELYTMHAIMARNDDPTFNLKILEKVRGLTLIASNGCWLEEYCEYVKNYANYKNRPGTGYAVKIKYKVENQLMPLMLNLYLCNKYFMDLGMLNLVISDCNSDTDLLIKKYNLNMSVYDFKKILFNTYQMHYQNIVEDEHIDKYDVDGSIKKILQEIITANSVTRGTGLIFIVNSQDYDIINSHYGNIITFKHKFIQPHGNLLFM